MAIRFKCSECDQYVNAPDDAYGKKGRCKNCGAILDIPEAENSYSLEQQKYEAAPAVTVSADDLISEQSNYNPNAIAPIPAALQEQ